MGQVGDPPKGLERVEGSSRRSEWVGGPSRRFEIVRQFLQKVQYGSGDPQGGPRRVEG